MIDAIALGLNMLSEELNIKVVEKEKLDLVNKKLEKFAYTTAHDLKSPLNSITGLLSLLEDSINPDASSEVALFISKLKVTTEKMKSLVEGILLYSKAGTDEIVHEVIQLTKAFNEIIEIDQISNKAEIQIIEPLPVVFFNPSSLYQVIRNLLGNAIKYSDKEVCKIVVQAKEREDHYQIMVTDNGPGIALENQEIIFKLFNKIDATANVDSHGIGLATIKSLLEDSGERIWVESTLGEGATFYFTLKKTIWKGKMIK
jgi:signal transduction histidine kinase